MKILVELKEKNIDKYKDIASGFVLGLKDFSVLNEVSYTLDEIKEITSKYNNIDIFVKIDKNIFNNEINELKDILISLDKLNIKGIFFYDLALLKLKKDLNLKVDLVWNQTHMVTNYRTCNYYYEKGVKYALMSKEITLEEIIDINKLSDIKTIVEVVSLPSVGFSRRKLVTNYKNDLNIEGNNELVVNEKVTGDDYKVIEDKSGTGFILNEVLNGTSVIKDLYENNTSYILMREYGLDNFYELVSDTRKYLSNKCNDTSYVEKYKKLGDNTGFFFKKTIYKVKK